MYKKMIDILVAAEDVEDGVDSKKLGEWYVKTFFEIGKQIINLSKILIIEEANDPKRLEYTIKITMENDVVLDFTTLDGELHAETLKELRKILVMPKEGEEGSLLI